MSKATPVPDDERYRFEDRFCRLDEYAVQCRTVYLKAMGELGRIIATHRIDRMISAVDDYRDEYQRDLDQHFDTGAPAPIWKGRLMTWLYCSSCGEHARTLIDGRCPVCAPTGRGYCVKCGDYAARRDHNGRCDVCSEQHRKGLSR